MSTRLTVSAQIDIHQTYVQHNGETKEPNIDDVSLASVITSAADKYSNIQDLKMLIQEFREKAEEAYNAGEWAEGEKLERQAVTYRKKLFKMDIDVKNYLSNISHTQLIINTEPTQFTVGKTKKCLDFIKTYGIKKINLYFVNNSLMENKQLVSRCYEAFKLNREQNLIVEFSSKSKKYNDKYAVQNLIERNRHSTKTLHIIMCHHHQRLEDIDDIIFDLSRSSADIKFNMVFDEIDNLMSNNFVSDKLNYWKRKPNIEHIIFQTATPTPYMFKKLKKIGIHDLKPIENLPFMEITNREEKIKQYCDSNSHTYIHKYGGKSSLAILKKIIRNKDIDINEKGLALFVPGEKKQVTHEQIRDYGIRKGFDIMFINGEFKGFCLQPGEGMYRNRTSCNWVSFDTFTNKQDKLSDISELKDIACVYREIFPDGNIILTGGYCVKRGITICTKGFNITHVIISDYWLLNSVDYKDCCEHNQLMGRVTGNSEYIKPAIIFCSKRAHKIRKAYEVNHYEIKRQNKECITYDDYNYTKYLEHCSSVREESCETKYENNYVLCKFGNGKKSVFNVVSEFANRHREQFKGFRIPTVIKETPPSDEYIERRIKRENNQYSVYRCRRADMRYSICYLIINTGKIKKENSQFYKYSVDKIPEILNIEQIDNLE